MSAIVLRETSRGKGVAVVFDILAGREGRGERESILIASPKGVLTSKGLERIDALFGESGTSSARGIRTGELLNEGLVDSEGERGFASGHVITKVEGLEEVGR